MTNIQVYPRVEWTEILKLLPKIQIGEVGESRIPIFVQNHQLLQDPVTGEYCIIRSGWGSIPSDFKHNSDFDELQREFADYLYRYYQGELKAAVEASVYSIMRALAEQVPYTQECTCADADNGLMAADCHVHYVDPMHFIGSMEFPCTCSQQNTSR